MNKNNDFLFKILYPTHILAWAGLIACLTIFGIDWLDVLYFIVGWILIEGVGVAVTLHRYVSHKSFVAKKWAEPIMLWLACLSLQGSPLGWAAVHRGSHHKYSDTDNDAHTPRKGKWYAWHAWLYDWDKYFNPKYAIDLLKDPKHVFIAKHYNMIVLGTYFVVALISWKLLLFGFLIPAALSLYQESTINVVCHSGNLGYRNFDLKDDSRNVPVMGWLTWGQGWHNNHHEKASAYDFGTTVSGNKKEFDPSLMLLPLVATKESRAQIFKLRKESSVR